MRKNIITMLAFGIGLGAFTSFGQSYLPDPFRQLANSYSVWLLVAFICGMFMSRLRWAFLSGAAIQYVALLTYYLLIHVRFNDGGFHLSSNVIWLIGGTLIGPVAGVAGKLYADRSKWSSYGLGLIVGVILSESLYEFLQLTYTGEGIVFLILALSVATSLLWKYESRIKAILPILAFSAIAYVGYAYIITSIFG